MTDDDDTLGEPLSSLTLTQLHARLQDAGVEIAYSTLSEIIKIGDTFEQLGGGGTGSKRSFPAAAANTLVEFFPIFRSRKVPYKEFANELRRFKTTFEDEPSRDLVPLETGLSQSNDPLSSTEMALIIARVQGYEQGLAETEDVLTAVQAAKLLQISTRRLRRTIPAAQRFGDTSSGDRWLRSQILRYMNNRLS